MNIMINITLSKTLTYLIFLLMVAMPKSAFSIEWGSLSADEQRILISEKENWNEQSESEQLRKQKGAQY